MTRRVNRTLFPWNFRLLLIVKANWLKFLTMLYAWNERLQWTKCINGIHQLRLIAIFGLLRHLRIKLALLHSNEKPFCKCERVKSLRTLIRSPIKICWITIDNLTHGFIATFMFVTCYLMERWTKWTHTRQPMWSVLDVWLTPVSTQHILMNCCYFPIVFY